MCSKHCFSSHIVLIMLFGIHLLAAPHVQNNQKGIGFTTFLTPSVGPTWGTSGNIKNCKTSATLHENAPENWKTNATLHGNACAVRIVQMGPQKSIPPKCPKPLFFKHFWAYYWLARMRCTKRGLDHNVAKNITYKRFRRQHKSETLRTKGFKTKHMPETLCT